MTTRRKLFAALAVTVFALPFAWAQTIRRRPIVGVLRTSQRSNEIFPELLRRDMAARGWVEKKNVEFLWAEGRNDKLFQLAAGLVARGVDVIVSFGEPGVRAAQKATATIPIVGMTDDLAGSGLVKSLARPSGNITGVSILATELDAKRLEVLRQAVPGARRVGVLRDPSTFNSMSAVEAAGRALGIDLVFFSIARTGAGVEAAVEALVKARVEAVLVLASPVLNAFRAAEVAEFARAHLPAIYQWPETAEEGGLIGYGPRVTACYGLVAGIVDKLLRGTPVGELPVEQPTGFELVINLKTAKALGITIPQSVLQRADKVIE